MYSNVNQQKRAIDFGDQQQWAGSSGDGYSSNEGSQKKKRKSRWGKDDIQEKTVIPGMPTVIPANLTKEQEQQYLLHLQIEEKSRRLRTGDLGIPPNPEDRSPSPEPIYNNEGKRLNTREYRTRKRLEEDRHRLVQEALALNSNYKPPPDYKPPLLRVNDKVMIPQEEHPDINFVGLLIGPRGNTLKTLEKETGAKIIIRGKGSVKDGKIGRKDGQPLPGEDEPLHAYVTANNPEYIKKAVEKIKSIIKESIEVPEGQNDLRKQQLRELALLNGTLRENDGLAKLRQLAQAQTIVTNTIICQNCGGAGHLSKDCKQTRPGETFHMVQQQQESSSSTDKAKMDREYLSLMAELGQGPQPPKQTNSVPAQRPQFQQQQQQQQQPQPSFTQPPPNPMGGFNNFQSSRFPPPMLLSMNNTRPPLSTMQNNQMSHQNIQPSGYHGNQPQNPMHPAGGLAQFKPHVSAPQPVAPPVSMSSQYPQSIQQMSAPVPVPSVPPPPNNSYSAPMQPPSWTSTVAVSQVNTLQTQSPAIPLGGLHPPTSMMTAPPPPSSVMTAPPPLSSMMTAPPPPSSVMTAPPPLSSMMTAPPPLSSMMTAPPPPSSMMTAPPPPSSMMTAPPPPSSMMTAPPPPSSMMTAPPPPSSLMTAPPMPTLLMSKPPPPPPGSNQLHTGPHMSWLQQGSVQPPPAIPSPWQQTMPPPSQVSMTMPWQQVARPSMPNTVIPPPPPPTTVQGFSMPPPPPGGVKQLLVAPPPPPPK